MKTYHGYSIDCGCTCSKCGRGLRLEGYSDADGNHYCPSCDDYVKPVQGHCLARTPEKVALREARIKRAGADKD